MRLLVRASAFVGACLVAWSLSTSSTRAAVVTITAGSPTSGSLYYGTDPTPGFGTFLGSLVGVYLTTGNMLAPDVISYLTIVGNGTTGSQGLMLAKLTIDDPGFIFANGTDTLLSGAGGWETDRTDVDGLDWMAPADLGENDGTLYPVSDSVGRMMWHPECVSCGAVFRATIYPIALFPGHPVSVPAPSALAVLAASLGALAASRRAVPTGRAKKTE